MMMYINLIWAWGHPEVYILILAGLRRVLGSGHQHLLRQTLVRLPLDGDRDDGHLPAVVRGMAAPLLHDGRGRQRETQCSLASMSYAIIAVPTGVKIFNWLFTLYGGRIRFTVPLHVVVGIHVDLHHRWHDRRVDGGAAGGFRACTTASVPGRAFSQRHHRRRVVRRHSPVTTTGSQKPLDSALDERWGKCGRSGAGWSGFYVAFIGRCTRSASLGMTRRMQHYDVERNLARRFCISRLCGAVDHR